ncbi:MAG TPA: LysR substrate-binding domain-containing protein, partial [Anaerolineae bacterium]|nr:LysR substrate-binding domain-containing protein [Anaerolineae bacterium]
ATLGPRFDTYAMALQAAIDGVGVALGLRPYVEDDIAAGRLVSPFSIAIPRGSGWYLVYRASRRDDPSLGVFRSWLHENLKTKSLANVKPRLKRQHLR